MWLWELGPEKCEVLQGVVECEERGWGGGWGVVMTAKGRGRGVGEGEVAGGYTRDLILGKQCTEH